MPSEDVTKKENSVDEGDLVISHDESPDEPKIVPLEDSPSATPAETSEKQSLPAPTPARSNDPLPRPPTAKPAYKITPKLLKPVVRKQPDEDSKVLKSQNVPKPLAHPKYRQPTVDAPATPYVYTDPLQAEELSKLSPEKTERQKERLRYILISLAIIIFVGGVIYAGNKILGSNWTYAEKTIVNNGTSYSFLFDENSTSQSSQGITSLTGNSLSSKQMVVNAYPSTSNEGDCKTVYPTLTALFTFKVQGKSYSACSISNQTGVLAFFEYSGKWNQINLISKNSKDKIDTPTAQKILGSLTVK